MIILTIIIYIYYLKKENKKRIDFRKQREELRQTKLQNKIQDFEEFKNKLRPVEQTYRINNISLLRNGYYIKSVHELYKESFIS